MVFKNKQQVFGKSNFKMHWVVGTWLITSLLGLGWGHNTLFEGYDRTLSGYHLCNVTELVSVTNVIPYPTSYIQRRPCGGWLAWTMCDVTVYKTEYETRVYNMSKQVMKCCPGYEQVGSYCALSLNRSAEFTSKPGQCPSANVTGSLWNNSNSSGSICKWDIDCPQWQKCCQRENISNIYECSDPVPPANRTCFNVTITVKTSFQLINMDKGLFNHTRLLHSVVTGALGTAEMSVHHVRSWSAGPFTTSSSLLVCSSTVFSQEDISTRLDRLGNIEEVTNVEVQDVDECGVPELNNCSSNAHCKNTGGSYSCACRHGYHDLNPEQPGADCKSNATNVGEQMSTTPSAPFWTSTVDPSPHTNYPSIGQPPSTCDYIPEITSLFSYDVNGSTFHVAWTTNNQTGVTFRLVLLNRTTEVENISHVGTFNWTFTNLNPAVLHTVRVTPFVCGIQGNSKEIKVRTDGQLILATARFTDIEYTEALNDSNSDAYKEFCRNVLDEILSSSPPEIRALVNSGQILIQITSLSPGSIIVKFSIAFQPGSNLNISSVSKDLVSLQNSTKYKVDSVYTEVLNECLMAEADCSPWASCEKTTGSYTCACWSGYRDLSPSRRGRSCEASPNATTSTVNPTTNHPEVSTNSTAMNTTSSIATTMLGNLSMTSTVSTGHVQSNENTTVSSTSTTSRPTMVLTTIPTTILTPMTQNPVRTPPLSQQVSFLAVECRPGSILVFVNRSILQTYSIPEDSLYLSKPECGLSQKNNSHVWLSTIFGKCGTTVEHNSTHTTFTVTLLKNVSMAPNVHLQVPITCTYPSSVFVSTGYGPIGSVEMITDPVAGFGSFQVTLRLLNGLSVIAENYTFSPNDEVIVEVVVNTSMSQVKVVNNNCWATSSTDPLELPKHMFLKDGCAVEDEYTTVLQNGNNTVSLVSVKIFTLVNLDIIFLHCQIQICVESPNNTCIPKCLKRTSRSSNFIAAKEASVGPLIRLSQMNYLLSSPPQIVTSNTLETVGFVLLGVGVFLLSLAVIAGLVYHKRKIGNYNFNIRPQQENFSYHVFST